MQNVSCENEFHLHEKEPVGGNIFSYKWFFTNIRFDIGEKK